MILISHFINFPGSLVLPYRQNWEASDPNSISIEDHEEMVGAKKRMLLVNNDLRISTRKVSKNPHVSYTFNAPSSSLVRVRYRFITEEVPAQYWGSKYNDYFSVTIRSEDQEGLARKTATMNALGREAFDEFSGSTNWREHALHLKGTCVAHMNQQVPRTLTFS